MRIGWIAVIALIIGCSPRVAPIAAVTVRDLGTGRCVAINRQGQVLGIDETEGTFIVDASGTRTALGVFEAGTPAVGVAISPTGEVAGYSEGSNGRTAIRYSEGAWHLVPGFGDDWSAATAIDASGRVVGFRGSRTEIGMRAFAVKDGGAEDLPVTFPGMSAAYLTASDRIAGILETETGDTHTFSLAGGRVLDLGTLGGESSAPYAMNSRGELVGVSETVNGTKRAFFAPVAGPMIDLGAPAGAVDTEARGLDDQDRIVGDAIGANGLSWPTVFAIGKSPVELSPREGSPYVSAHVAGMAPNGLIVGWGVREEPQGSSVRCLEWSSGR